MGRAAHGSPTCGCLSGGPAGSARWQTNSAAFWLSFMCLFFSFFVTNICCSVLFWRQNVKQKTSLGFPHPCPGRPIQTELALGPRMAAPTPHPSNLSLFLPPPLSSTPSLQARCQEPKKVKMAQFFSTLSPNALYQSFLDAGANPSNAGERNYRHHSKGTSLNGQDRGFPGRVQSGFCVKTAWVVRTRRGTWGRCSLGGQSM